MEFEDIKIGNLYLVAGGDILLLEDKTARTGLFMGHGNVWSWHTLNNVICEATPQLIAERADVLRCRHPSCWCQGDKCPICSSLCFFRVGSEPGQEISDSRYYCDNCMTTFVINDKGQLEPIR